MSCLIRFNGTGFELVEDLKFTNAPEYPWMMPEVEHLSYEEFFAEERGYTGSDAPWYVDYISTLNGMWYVRSVDSSTAYEWESNENGIFICRLRKEENPLHWIPNTADLVDCTQAISNTRQLYCAQKATSLSPLKISRSSETKSKRKISYEKSYCHRLSRQW